MRTNLSWEELHDAVLKEISYEWSTGRCEITLTLCSSPASSALIRIEGVLQLVVPREEPWGPSESVNRATLLEEVSPSTLEIQMQSGDTILVRATSTPILVIDDSA